MNLWNLKILKEKENHYSPFSYADFEFKAFKKDISKKLMNIAWHPTRWSDWCLSQDEKKE